MILQPYRETLRLPGIKQLLLVATLARLPATAGTVVLTLHVLVDLHRGYGAAGLVGAAFTLGGSIGAPVIGRLIDHRGLRPALVLTTLAECAFWAGAAATTHFWVLLIAALFGGSLALPAFAVARQSIAALTPNSHRLPAFALDSITTELGFMIGPVLAVAVAVGADTRMAMLTISSAILLAGLALFFLHPPMGQVDRPARDTSTGWSRRRAWLTPQLFAVFAVTAAATMVLSGTDITIVASLRAVGETAWIGAVNATWALYSLIGGFAYGTLHRPVSPFVLLATLAVATVPVGLATGHWWWLALALMFSGGLCAPTITSTADAVSRAVPAVARGEGMGLHNSALTAGVMLGGPLAGAFIDAGSPWWGFAGIGGIALAIGVVASATHRYGGRARATRPDPLPPEKPPRTVQLTQDWDALIPLLSSVVAGPPTAQTAGTAAYQAAAASQATALLQRAPVAALTAVPSPNPSVGAPPDAGTKARRRTLRSLADGAARALDLSASAFGHNRSRSVEDLRDRAREITERTRARSRNTEWDRGL
jgi:MFS family permease